MPGNGDRSGGAEARATEGTRSGNQGGGAGLPAGVAMQKDGTDRIYSFTVGGKTVKFGVEGDRTSATVAFSVGGQLDRGGLQGRDADRAALTIARIFKHDVSTRPDGFQYDTSAWTGDGYGARRAAAYERAGFSPPMGGIPGLGQFGVVKNGKLQPDTF